MYLFDTNIFLEILLFQKNSEKCKKVLSDTKDGIFISDFSLHSIGVILFRYNRENVFDNFVSDILPKIDIISLSTRSYENLSEIKKKYNLDFDDAYQYKIAIDNSLTIITMDKDFKRVQGVVELEFI